MNALVAINKYDCFVGNSGKNVKRVELCKVVNSPPTNAALAWFDSDTVTKQIFCVLRMPENEENQDEAMKRRREVERPVTSCEAVCQLHSSSLQQRLLSPHAGF